MTTEQITAGTTPGTNGEAECLQDYNLAKEAADKGDAKQILKLYEKIVIQRGHLLESIRIISEHAEPVALRSTFGKNPLNITDPDSVAAIKEIAFEAISLAKIVIQSKMETKL